VAWYRTVLPVDRGRVDRRAVRLGRHIMASTAPVGPDGSRATALDRLRRRRAFYRHLLLYSWANGLLIVIWAMSGTHGFFWPVFSLGGWGLAVLLHGWDALQDEEFTDREVRREQARQRRHR
jgi:hypothetical protein